MLCVAGLSRYILKLLLMCIGWSQTLLAISVPRHAAALLAAEGPQRASAEEPGEWAAGVGPAQHQD